jgi:sialidase-1
MPGASQQTAFEDVVAFKVDPPAFTRGVNGDMIELSDGRLLYAFGDTPDGPEGMLACYSHDRGRTWSEPRTLLPMPDKALRCPGGEWASTPSFLRRRNGQLMMSFIWAVNESDPYGHTYYRISLDDGQTWSDPKVITSSDSLYTLVHNNKLLRLSDGRILAPAEIRIDVGLNDDHRGYVSTAWFSDDDGHIWKRSDNVVDMLAQGVEAQEPHVVELKDGRLLMLFRTYSGFVGQSYSQDRGRTWSPGEKVDALPLPAGSSALHVSRIPSTGDLLLVRCIGNGGKRPDEHPRVFNRRDGHKHPIRTPLTSCISRDEGRTWTHERIIAGDPYGDFGYPCVLHLDDVTLIGYHAFDGLHVARVTPDWFYE